MEILLDKCYTDKHTVKFKERGVSEEKTSKLRKERIRKIVEMIDFGNSWKCQGFVCELH